MIDLSEEAAMAVVHERLGIPGAFRGTIRAVPRRRGGVANQLADQQRAADARGLVIVRTECDNDISALDGRRRPGYEAVMAAAVRGEIDVILVFQTSRFWRNRRERAEGIEILRRAGVSLPA